VDETQTDLAKKRKEFEHYKNRAQTEMAISLQVACTLMYTHMRARAHTQTHTHTHTAGRCKMLRGWISWIEL
jgi:hypothetical protein